MKRLIFSTLATLTLIAPGADARQPVRPEGFAWLDGQLSDEQANSLAFLSYPQTYQDMRGRYGQPAYRSDTADYYQVNGQWVAIAYDANNQATGFDFWQ
jgi:hypothetical protein